MPNRDLPPGLAARYTTERDEDGPYFKIYLGDQMLAYADEESGAALIVSALNLSTNATVDNLAAEIVGGVVRGTTGPIL